MIETTVPTYTATVFVGLREGYNGPQHSVAEAEDVVQAYVNQVGLCVTVTPTTYIYKGGREPGVAVGLINYGRFPSTPARLREKAIDLACILKTCFGQLRVSVVLPDETVMLGDVA